MGNKFKICFISQFPPPIHGLSKAVDTLYRAQAMNESFELEFIDTKDNSKFIKTCNRIRKSDSDLFYFTISQSKYGNLRDLKFLSLILKKKKKCVIHLHGGKYRELLENEMFSFQKKLNIRLFSQVDAAIVLSNILVKNFINVVEKDRIFIVPNCFDEEFKISDEEFENKLSLIDVTSPKILYLSNFIKEKGYETVLMIALLFKKNNRKGEFHFAGKFFNKSDENAFFEFVEKNGLSNVFYHGIVMGSAKKDLLVRSTHFILPTIYKNEGQPISILEAMANGLIVMSTNWAGIPDIVDDSNGFVCDVNSDLVDNYYNYLIRPIDLGICRINRSKANEYFAQARYIANMKNVFDMVLKAEERS